MKKQILVRLIFSASLIIMSVSVDSCSSNCKMCAINQYENGSLINAGTETEYCGADLIKQEAIPDVTVGSVTTKVECR